MEAPTVFSRTRTRVAVIGLATASVLSISLASPADAASVYTVKRGETLNGIANRHGVGAAALARANNITNANKIREGQKMTIPTGGAPAAPVTAPTPTAAPAPSGGVAQYTVQKGDNLGKIARQFKVSLSSLASANGIANVNKIRFGMKLTIPGATPVAVPAPTPAQTNLVAQPNKALTGLPASLRNNPTKMSYMPYFDKWAAANGLPADLVKAIGWQESGWRPEVRSYAGAIGIGQLMPATAAYNSKDLIGVPLDPNNPEHNIRMSARYIRFLLKQQNGDVNLAIGSYYQGYNSIARYGVRADTQKYIASVNALRSYFV